MKKIIAPLALSAPLLLCSCSSVAQDGGSSSATITEVVTTTQLSEAEQKEQLKKTLRSGVPAYQVNQGNLQMECAMAIDEKLQDAGNFDFPVDIDMQPLSEGSEIYTSSGEFRYEDANDVWQEGFYSCQAITEDGVIQEASAVAF